MKSTMTLKEYKSMKEKKLKKAKFEENDDMSILLKKRNTKAPKNSNSEFRNNYKNYQYDYEEDFYEPRY